MLINYDTDLDIGLHKLKSCKNGLCIGGKNGEKPTLNILGSVEEKMTPLEL